MRIEWGAQQIGVGLRISCGFLLSTILVTGAACGAHKSDVDKTKYTEAGGNKHMTSKVINISDDQYFHDFSDQIGAIEQELSRQNHLGIFVDGPKIIDGAAHDRLPILAIEHRTFEEGGKANFAKHAAVIGIDLDRNIVYANKAVEQEDNFIEEAPASLPGEALETPKGSYAKYEVFDARTRLGFPWRAGNYRFFVALQHQVFEPLNTVIALANDAGTQRTGGTALPTLISPLPEEPLPSFRSQKDSPQSPNAPGIAVTVAPTITLRGDATAPLYAAFSLKPLPSELVTPEEWRARVDEHSRQNKIVQNWLQTDHNERVKQLAITPSATIPITLVVLGSIDGFITSFTIRAPSYARIAADGTVRGNFALDLLRVPGIPKTAQTYYIYAVSGEILEKPVITEFVKAN